MGQNIICFIFLDTYSTEIGIKYKIRSNVDEWPKFKVIFPNVFEFQGILLNLKKLLTYVFFSIFYSEK